MKNNIFKYICLSLVASLAIMGCRKDSFEGDETKDSGTTFLKVNEGAEIKRFFSPFTDVKDVHMFSLRRDAANNTELNQTATVKLATDNGIIDQYNEDHDETFEVLPASFYTLSADAGYTATATGFDVVFSPGDFSKNFKIKIDGSKWNADLSKKYAVAFKITDFGGIKTTSETSDSLIVLLSIKNKYDGVYSVTGTMVDATNGTLTHINNFLSSALNTTGVVGPMQYELRTISPTTCVVYDNHFFVGNYVPITSGDTYSQYGSFALIVEFDPVTDKVVAVTNFFGQPAPNTRSGRVDPSGVNQYDAGSKTVDIKYNMIQPSVVTAAPHVRTTWTETWTFIGERN